MASYINTNIASLNAQRNLTTSQSSLTTSLQRLSSGLRINTAKDDAAGLAISQRMNAQVNGLNQASRNANDAISLAQTADGALSGIQDNLQRLRTLAVQAANSTNSDTDRAAIQLEVSQLVQEIGRVSQTTEFNGVKLLDGSFSGQSFHVGANANQTISVSLDSAETSKLGSTQASSVTAMNKSGTGAALQAADLTINGVAVGASQSSTDTASTASKSFSAISKVAAINAVSAQTGVTATVNANTVGGAAQTLASGVGTFTINGVATANISLGGADAATDRAAVVAAINAKSGQTGVQAVDAGTSGGGVKLIAADGRNIAIASTSGSGTFAGSHGVDTTNATVFGTFSLSSSKAITITGSKNNLDNAGLVAGTYSTQTAYASSTSGTSTAFGNGDFKINGVIVGASYAASDTASTTGNASSAISKAAAINAVSSQSGVKAVVNSNTLAGATMTAASGVGTFTINGVTTDAVTLTTDNSANVNNIISAINAKSGQTGVTAVFNGTSATGISLIAADGRNIAISSTSSSGTFSGSHGIDTTNATVYGTFTLTSAKTFNVEAASTATMSSIGMLGVGSYGAGKSGQSLDSLNVGTTAGANNAIVAIDNAINSINTARANLGAIQNRFNSTISTLNSTSENLTAARSRITDADSAAETANLTRAQILQQAGTAMLAQANGLPNGILALLR